MMLDDKQQLDQLERTLHEALLKNDLKKLQKLIHLDFTYTDESGTTYQCLADLQAKNPSVPKLESIHVLEREVNYFQNVAVVTSIELRTNTLNEQTFKAKCVVSRIWKKQSSWCLLSVTVSRI